MDIAVLEWCKLFAGGHGYHTWDKVVSDPKHFTSTLLSHLQLTAAEFGTYCNNVRAYRDNFIAHLDGNPKAQYPVLDIAIQSTTFLYSYLRSKENNEKCLHDLPRSLESVYRVAFAQARTAYGSR